MPQIQRMQMYRLTQVHIQIYTSYFCIVASKTKENACIDERANVTESITRPDNRYSVSRRKVQPEIVLTVLCIKRSSISAV